MRTAREAAGLIEPSPDSSASILKRSAAMASHELLARSSCLVLCCVVSLGSAVMTVLSVLPHVIHHNVWITRPALIGVVSKRGWNPKVERYVRARPSHDFATPPHGNVDLESSSGQRDVDLLAIGHYQVSGAHMDTNMIVDVCRNGFGSQDPRPPTLKLHEIEVMRVVSTNVRPLPVLSTRLDVVDRDPAFGDLGSGMVMDLDGELTARGRQ